MPISRTKVNALVDDDGSGTVGTSWAKARVADIYDDIDAYVELTGTWTPTLTFGGAAVGMTYGTRTGTYTRSGDIFVVEMRIVLTAKGSSTGGATITGLPVAANLFPACIIDCATGMVGLTGTPMGTISGTTLTPVQTSATARTQLTEAHFSNTSDLRLGLTYRV